MKYKIINDSELLKIINKVNELFEEANHNPQDFSFRLITSKYGEPSHIVFGFPDKFIKKEDTKVFKRNGRGLMMDCARHVGPGGFITRESTINVEHQSTPLNSEKIDSIYNYKLALIHKNNMPSISVVITKLGSENRKILYESNNDYFVTYKIVITYEDICKRLNMLRDLINSNKKLSAVEALYFTYIAIFVDNDHGKEILAELAGLFEKAIIEDSILKGDVHQVLKMMIKYHFKEDKNKTWELLFVITKPIDIEEYDNLSSYEWALENIEERDIFIEKLNNNLQERDEVISNQKEIISNYAARIEELEEQLAAK